MQSRMAKVRYRGHYLHDGSGASLEEMFDPDRLKETHVPRGWIPPGVKIRAIMGHSADGYQHRHAVRLLAVMAALVITTYKTLTTTSVRSSC